jgi:hypothetical protein
MRAFKGIDDFKKLLLDDKDAFLVVVLVVLEFWMAVELT